MAGPIARYFRFAERSTDLATELRAGLTTYMVMAYIIFVNPSVLGLVGVPGLEGKGLPFAATLTATCLTAGVLSIAMGLASNYPLVLAPGMGLNAVVAFELVATRGLTWPQAMTVVFLEGVAITLLVLTRFRETVMDAVPLGLKRAIGVGIGLFIAFIGFFTSGFVVKPLSGPLPVALGTFGGLPAVVFVLGFILTAWLMARRVRGALLLGIVLTTLLAIVLNGALASWQGFSTPGAARIPAAIVEPPDLSTVGRLDFGLVARLGVVTAVLVTFSIMLSDFFDTMGTIIGVGGKAGFLDARGRLPGVNRVLLGDSLGAALGGLANASSNTTYIESAAGVAEGGRTGLPSVVVGVLFLLSMFFSPLASVIPAQATAPALILVGFFMMTIAREIPWDDYEEAIPAFVTMLTMPFTWSITNGIGAGFVTYGTLNAARDNVILVAPFYSGNSHAAGKYAASDPAPGYWDAIIGSGKPVDTDRFFVVSSDTLVNLNVKDPKTITTGPASINSDTGRPYGMSFPIVTIRDFVNVQKALLDSLGIKKLHAVMGASMGALQSFEWAAAYPDMVERIVPVIGAAELNAFGIGWLGVWAAPIMLDPRWNKGDYYGQEEPVEGLALALKIVTLHARHYGWASDPRRAPPDRSSRPCSSA